MNTLALDTDGRILIGGPFTMIPPSRITSKVKADVVHRILSALFSRAVKDGQDSSKAAFIDSFAALEELRAMVAEGQVTSKDASLVMAGLARSTGTERAARRKTLTQQKAALATLKTQIAGRNKRIGDCGANGGATNCSGEFTQSFRNAASAFKSATADCLQPSITVAPTSPRTAPPTTVGDCPVTATWVHTTVDIGSTTWTVTSGGIANETGIGNATGTAALAGHTLTITFVASDKGTTGVYSWTLAPDCRSGQGTLRFTGPPSRVGETHNSTIVRSGG